MYWNNLSERYPKNQYRLIETWDVLKSLYTPPRTYRTGTINRNMRCIEMRFDHILAVWKHWLIETWDVLKFFPETSWKWQYGLIETWDVLKFSKHLTVRLKEED